MDWVHEIFSHLCGSGRRFVVDGAALPLCQRCLGLYVGAAVTLAWLIASGIWRCGLGGKLVNIVRAACLLAAMIAGIGWIDPGERWRFLFGLWTGHVAICWMIGGAGSLWRAARPQSLPLERWRPAETLQAIVAPAAIAMIASGFPLLAGLGWWFWTLVSVLGVAAVVGTTGYVLSATAISLVAARIRRK